MSRIVGITAKLTINSSSWEHLETERRIDIPWSLSDRRTTDLAWRLPTESIKQRDDQVSWETRSLA